MERSLAPSLDGKPRETCRAGRLGERPPGARVIDHLYVCEAELRQRPDGEMRALLGRLVVPDRGHPRSAERLWATASRLSHSTFAELGTFQRWSTTPEPEFELIVLWGWGCFHHPGTYPGSTSVLWETRRVFHQPSRRVGGCTRFHARNAPTIRNQSSAGPKSHTLAVSRAMLGVAHRRVDRPPGRKSGHCLSSFSSTCSRHCPTSSVACVEGHKCRKPLQSAHRGPT